MGGLGNEPVSFFGKGSFFYPGKVIQNIKPNIMPGALIFCPGVSQSSN